MHIHKKRDNTKQYKLLYTGKTFVYFQLFNLCIASENDYFERTVLEMIHIKKDENCVNNRNDNQNLSDIYNKLIMPI